MRPELPDDPPSVPEHGPARSRLGDLGTEWRESVGALRQAATRAAKDVAGLRQDLSVATRRLHQEELRASDPDGVDRLLSALEKRLENVETRLKTSAAQIEDGERRASAAAVASVRRLGAELQGLNAAPGGDGLTAIGTDMDAVEARLTETIHRTTRELRQHLSRGLADSGGGWDVLLDGLAEVRKALDQVRDAAPTTAEIVAMVPHAVQGLEEQIAEAVAARMSSTGATSAKQLEAIRRDISAELNEGLAAIEEAVRSVASTPEQPETAGGRTKRSDTERQLAVTTTALRKEIEAFRKRIEGWGKPRTAPRLAEEVQRLEGHVSDLGRAVEEQLAAKVARRVLSSIDRRLGTLIGELPEHLRETIAEAVHEAAAGSVAEVVREAVREAAEEAVREAAEEAVREAAEEAVREALHQPARPLEAPSESKPPTEAGRPRLRFRQ